MRPITFRAWDKDRNSPTDRMSPPMTLFEMLTTANKVGRNYEDDHLESFYGKLIYMQSTGLKDRKGVEIFEGDIVRGNPIGSTGDRVGKVDWMYDGWFVSDESDRENEKRLHVDFFGKVEIIGNIYENPHLLK